MHYLTIPFSLNFSANTKPSYSRQVNGMSTKTNAVKHALNCNVISDMHALKTLDTDDLLIEPLFFKDYEADEKFSACIDALKKFPGKKTLLCSEMEPFRWTGTRAAEILSAIDTVLSSCKFQSKLLETIEITVDRVVYEPVNEHLFFPASEKENWVVAIGAPTHVKNVDALIKIFQGLEGTPLKRVYIGGPIVWGNVTSMKHEAGFDNIMKKYETLKAVSDIYYPPSAQTKVAYILSKAKYYLNFAYHETCCRTAMEAMLSGVGILAGKHPLFKEYPCVAKDLTTDACIELLKEMPAVDMNAIRKWALENVSYKAFRRAVREALNA